MAEVLVVEFDEYETLPTHRLHVHLLAGAAAGMMEHCVMYPIDSVKTRLQSLAACPERRFRTPVGGLLEMMRREGVWRPLRGIRAVAMGAVPAHALYFTCYERAKHALTGGRAGHHHAWAYGVAGGSATLVHDAIMNPAEVVKQRMQMCSSPYQSSVDCARCVYRTEGLTAFYRSYSVQLLLNLPFQSIHFVVYEFWQQILNPKHEYHPSSHMIAGGLAGGIAAAITTPFDVVKTVLNTQQQPSASLALRCPLSQEEAMAQRAVSFRGISEAVRCVVRARGFGGFFGGLQARVLFQVPATGISWSVYELFKYALSWRRTGDAPTSPPS